MELGRRPQVGRAAQHAADGCEVDVQFSQRTNGIEPRAILARLHAVGGRRSSRAKETESFVVAKDLAADPGVAGQLAHRERLLTHARPYNDCMVYDSRMTTPPDIPTTHPFQTEGWEREIYPMPAFPVIVASDLSVSSRWYQEILGFADVFTMRGADDRPMLAHLRWSRWADVLITQARTPVQPPHGQGITLNFMTLRVDALAERARVLRRRDQSGEAVTRLARR